jgi:RNA polymerase sigma factor (TIGR02999 family)
MRALVKRRAGRSSGETAAASVTAVLHAWRQGNPGAEDRLFAMVYAELKRQAAGHLRRERREHTLSPTAVVHEAYLRLVAGSDVEWQDRTHFLAVASQVMRRLLVDHARARLASKRPQEKLRVTLDGLPAASSCDAVALDEALEALAMLDARQSQLVVLRYFGGLSVDETAEALAISPATVKREWTVARAWLHRRLKTGHATGAPG